MTITLEAIRAAGGIVHSDGNIFFRDISMLQGLAGAAPAAVAGPAWDKTRDSLATLLLGLARRPFLDFDVACIALDAATEPGMPLAYMRGAQAAPALEAPAAETIAQAITDNFRDAGWSMPSIDAARVLEAVKSALRPAAAPQAPAAPGIDQLLDALSQHDDPCEDIADALDRVRVLRAEADRRIRAENTLVDRMAHLSAGVPTSGVLNVLRVALNRANMDYRATGFKPFEIDAAKTWVASAAPAVDARDAALQQAISAMQLAQSSHGTMLTSDPPQEMWKFHGVSLRLQKAIDAAQAAAKGEHDAA